MRLFIMIAGLVTMGLLSCKKFLEEKPQGFLTTSQFYTTPNQIRAAVDGAYNGMELPFVSVFLGLPINEFYSFESLTGFSTNDFGTGDAERTFQRLDVIDPQNSYLQSAYDAIYIPMENINSVIANISATTVIDEATRNRYLGQLYFLRAYQYFHGVQLFGEIPLKITPTESIKDVTIPKATIERNYTQIVADLTEAEKAGLPWTDETGHATLGAVKTLLAKVYMAMAGYPLNKGREYYGKAYEKSAEVIASGEFNLFPGYADLRSPANSNKGEHIFMIQRKKVIANNELHYAMLPAPGKTNPPISVNNFFDPALRPTMAFYNTYAPGDRRTNEKAYFYMYAPGEVMNYKYWDSDAATAPPSGANIPRLRYADVLLICAEAKAVADGGTTADAVALDAYYQVRHRAFPDEAKPASITVNQVLKERFWELSFEYQIWFDMIRTRKTLDVASRNIVNLLGHKATTHLREFRESDLLLPLPLTETQKNPKLNDPAE